MLADARSSCRAARSEPHVLRSDFILDEIDASSLRFLRSRPPHEAELQRGPLTDGHDARRAQRSGDRGRMGFVTTIAGRPHPAFPRGTDTLSLRRRHGQGAASRRTRPRRWQRSGGDEGTRTPDPLLAKEVLSQLSYIPIAVGMVPPRRGRRYGGVIRRLGSGGSGSPVGHSTCRTTQMGVCSEAWPSGLSAKRRSTWCRVNP